MKTLAALFVFAVITATSVQVETPVTESTPIAGRCRGTPPRCRNGMSPVCMCSGTFNSDCSWVCMSSGYNDGQGY